MTVCAVALVAIAALGVKQYLQGPYKMRALRGLIMSYQDKVDAEALWGAIESKKLDVVFDDNLPGEAAFIGVQPESGKPTMLVGPNIFRYQAVEARIVLFHEYRHYQQFLNGGLLLGFPTPEGFYSPRQRITDDAVYLYASEVEAHFRECRRANKWGVGGNVMFCEVLKNQGAAALANLLGEGALRNIPEYVDQGNPEYIANYRKAIEIMREVLVQEKYESQLPF